MIHKALMEKISNPISISSRVTIKIRRNIGIEVSFVDSVPKLTGGKSPVVYVIFQSIDLPRKFNCV